MTLRKEHTALSRDPAPFTRCRRDPAPSTRCRRDPAPSTRCRSGPAPPSARCWRDPAPSAQLDAMSEEPSAVDAMSEGSSAVDAMSEGSSAVGVAQRRRCDVGGTQRRRRGPAPSARCRIKELNDVWTMQERPVDAHRCHDDGRTIVVTTTARENKRPERWWDSRLRRGVSRKDVLTLSPILTGHSLHFRYYCWFFTSRATPNVMLLVSMKSKTVFQTDTLYSCLLSLVSLSLSGLFLSGLSGLAHTLLS